MRKFLPFLVILGGCGAASTEITSFVDPDFEGRTYERLFVQSSMQDLQNQAAAERAFVAELRRQGVAAEAAMDVLPPTREHSPEQIDRAWRDGGFDGLLVIELRAAGHTDYFIPQSYTTYYTGYSSTSIGFGGYPVQQPFAEFEIRLRDSGSDRVAWVASASTWGTSSSTLDDLYQSLASWSVLELQQKGLLPPLAGS